VAYYCSAAHTYPSKIREDRKEVPRKPAVLFVCRSPLAEAAFRAEVVRIGLDVEVDSAGTCSIRSRSKIRLAVCPLLRRRRLVSFQDRVDDRNERSELRPFGIFCGFVGQCRPPFNSAMSALDRALIATLTYSFARITAALKMKVENLRPQGAGWRLPLREKGSKHHTMPCHHALVVALHRYSVH
jgi:Low molecular weight phosphotyrosine protein phosphatase